MKAARIKTVELDLSICGAGLLSVWTYRQYEKIIPMCRDDWWLSTPDSRGHVLCVSDEVRHEVKEKFVAAYAFVRPVLRVKTNSRTKLHTGERILISPQAHEFTVLDDGVLLYNATVGLKRAFNNKDYDSETCNEYSESTIIEHIDEWVSYITDGECNPANIEYKAMHSDEFGKFRMYDIR